MSRLFVDRHMFRHRHRHVYECVYGHMHGHVYRHVCRHAYRHTRVRVRLGPVVLSLVSECHIDPQLSRCCGWLGACKHVCDICVHVRVDMCLDLGTDMHVGVCMGLCTDMCAAVCIDTRPWTFSKYVCGHVRRHLYRYLCGQLH